MKVYAIHVGNRYLGGEIVSVYSQKWIAIRKAEELIPPKQKWWPTTLEPGVVFARQNTWNEVLVYEFPLQ